MTCYKPYKDVNKTYLTTILINVRHINQYYLHHIFEHFTATLKTLSCYHLEQMVESRKGRADNLLLDDLYG